MQTRITIRFEVDKELGNELGKAYPLFGGQAFQEHTFTLKGDDLQQHLPLLLPFAERLGMALCGERGKPVFPLPDWGQLASFLCRHLRVMRTISLCGEEDRREVPAERLLSGLAAQLATQEGACS